METSEAVLDEKEELIPSSDLDDTLAYLPDIAEIEARELLKAFFDEHRAQVFFSRQIEVQNEKKYFHWVTNRAIRDLVALGILRSEKRKLKNAGSINLLWHKNYRYHKRSALSLIDLVEKYSDPNIGAALGLHGESMVLEGFARCEFVMKGRHSRAYGGREWTNTNHNLDFIFERDSIVYGVEVKNTLGYMDYDEFLTKIQLCKFLNIRPLFAARMLPRTWIKELIDEGGFALIFEYQLYPWTHLDIARQVALELNLPVDAPKSLQDGTMQRFLNWHQQQV